MKSLVILASWLILSVAIYLRIALSFALNRIFFSANENGTVKQNNQSDFKAFFKLTNHIAGKWKMKKPLFGKFGYKVVRFQNGSNKVAIEFWVWCNFGLKSYLWFQIERALRAFDFEIRLMISDQIALHSVQLPL